DAPLGRVANVERSMPKAYIRKDGYGITAAARRYLEPLIAGEAYPSYEKGLPRYVPLRNELARKKLQPWSA
ncbi:MAG: diphosphate--fructose-6-phosphate 1-phosphotransferase, partial [Gammaproteobacteria bacterium]|nr:diphosphate--fructose-6-phosphate 1-phosphotransferase [Gammaproteobacteria bacterium]